MYLILIMLRNFVSRKSLGCDLWHKNRMEVGTTRLSRSLSRPTTESGPATDCWDANDSSAKFRLNDNDDDNDDHDSSNCRSQDHAHFIPTTMR